MYHHQFVLFISTLYPLPFVNFTSIYPGSLGSGKGIKIILLDIQHSYVFRSSQNKVFALTSTVYWFLRNIKTDKTGTQLSYVLCLLCC